jgi:hypothetical protein
LKMFSLQKSKQRLKIIKLILSYKIQQITQNNNLNTPVNLVKIIKFNLQSKISQQSKLQTIYRIKHLWTETYNKKPHLDHKPQIN